MSDKVSVAVCELNMHDVCDLLARSRELSCPCFWTCKAANAEDPSPQAALAQ
jgi:hypothetical protein